MWTRVADGTASAAELAELTERAEHDPAVRAMLDACRPPPPGTDAALAAHLTERVERRRSTRRRALAAGGALAIAASVTVAVLVGGADPLPRYVLETGRGASEVRGTTDDDVLELWPSTVVRVTLRPIAPVEGEVVVSAFLRTERGLVPWDPPFERSGSGVARIEARADSLWPQELAPRAMIFVVDRASRTIDDIDEQRRRGRVLERPVRLISEAP